MKYSTLWVLILLVLWTMPGCGFAGSENTATIVIAEGNSLLFQTAEQPAVIYQAGDSVLVEWESDTCYVNGQAHWPQPPVAPTMYPLERLKDHYGKVPSVVEYVESHSGDEMAVWNEAVRHWDGQTQALSREVARQYTADINSGKTPDEAAEAVLEMVRASPLADSPRVDEARREANSTTRIIRFRWTGLSVGTSFMCTPMVELDRPSLPSPMTFNQFKSFVRMLRGLEREGPVTIELRGGSGLYITGPLAEERMRER